MFSFFAIKALDEKLMNLNSSVKNTCKSEKNQMDLVFLYIMDQLIKLVENWSNFAYSSNFSYLHILIFKKPLAFIWQGEQNYRRARQVSWTRFCASLFLCILYCFWHEFFHQLPVNHNFLHTSKGQVGTIYSTWLHLLLSEQLI